MKRSTFGALAASAVLGLVGGAVLAPAAHAADEKACYRPHCGKSVKGHEAKCGGTRIDDLNDQASCEAAGGAWATADEAKAFKKKDS